MLITEVRSTTVAVPTEGQMHHSDGMDPAWQVRRVIEIVTDDGHVGVGEVGPRVLPDMLTTAARQLVGADPRNLQEVKARLGSGKFYRMSFASLVAGVQIACLDLQGKAFGCSVSELLGGRMRDRVPFIAYVYRTSGFADGREAISDEGLVEYAADVVARHGFTTIKFKAAAGTSPEHDVEVMQALRQRFPNAKLRVDPNGAWSLATSLQVAQRLADLDLEWLEDPTLGTDAMAAVARRTPIPLATNMCCIHPGELAENHRAGSIDVMLLDTWYLGGPWSARHTAETCRALGIGLGMHSGGGGCELGVGMAAQIHLAASIPGMVHASDAIYHNLLDDVLVGGKLTPEDGSYLVPTGPGLGVTLDQDKLAEYAELYASVSADIAPRPFPLYPQW